MDLCIHPLCRLKNPTVIKIWLLVGFRPATRSVQSTPAERQAVYIGIKKGSIYKMRRLIRVCAICHVRQIIGYAGQYFNLT